MFVSTICKEFYAMERAMMNDNFLHFPVVHTWCKVVLPKTQFL